MIKNKLLFTTVLGSTLLLAACATIFGSGSQAVTIKSDPSGASIFLDEKEVGKTPMAIDLDKSTFSHPNLRLEKEGYVSQNVKIKKTLATVSLFNLGFILTTLGASSWATDALSGKMIQYSPTSYFLTLAKKGKETAYETPKEQRLRMARVFANVYESALREDLARGGRGEHLHNYLLQGSSNSEEYQKRLEFAQANAKELLAISDANSIHDKIFAQKI